MSSPRVQKIFQGMTESLRKLGPYESAFKTGIKWQGIDTAGEDAVVIDVDSPTWGTGNRRVIITASVAGSTMPAAMRTQSHAAGHFLDGSVSFVVRVETPASFTNAHNKFMLEILHVLRGQLGAPMELLLTANGVEPRLPGSMAKS